MFLKFFLFDHCFKCFGRCSDVCCKDLTHDRGLIHRNWFQVTKQTVSSSIWRGQESIWSGAYRSAVVTLYEHLLAVKIIGLHWPGGRWFPRCVFSTICKGLFGVGVHVFRVLSPVVACFLCCYVVQQLQTWYLLFALDRNWLTLLVLWAVFTYWLTFYLSALVRV